MGKITPRTKEEPEYAACLLVAGPPKYLKQPVTEPCPTSSLAYKSDCSDWYRDNVHSQASRRMFYVIDMSGKFDKWYARYKTWLMESRRG